MDVINGIPALYGDDPMSQTSQYTLDLRAALSPVAGRREGLPDGDTPLPGGQSYIALAGFTYQLGGTGPSPNGGITVPETGIYYVAAGLRLGSVPSSEVQLRINDSNSSGRIAIQSGTGFRHFNASSTVLVTGGSNIDLQVFNGGSENTTDTFFDGLPYLSVYLLHRID